MKFIFEKIEKSIENFEKNWKKFTDEKQNIRIKKSKQQDFVKVQMSYQMQKTAMF